MPIRLVTLKEPDNGRSQVEVACTIAGAGDSE